MIPPLFFLTLASSIPLALLLTSSLIANNSTPSNEKLSPFESGFDPLNSARIPFSLRFFLLAVIFLVFDIEIAILLPLPLTPNLNHPSFYCPSIVLFLLILILGLIHEWQEGSLEWSP